MPSRVIRGDILSSRSLSRVSRGADWFFQRLILAVDEFGRCDARLEVLRSVCFPARPDVTEAEIQGWLTELQQCDPSGSGPVQVYTVGGWQYLALINWEKHRGKSKRAETSKFPDPRDCPRNSAELRGSPGESGLWSGGSGLVSGGSGVGLAARSDERAPEPEGASRPAPSAPLNSHSISKDERLTQPQLPVESDPATESAVAIAALKRDVQRALNILSDAPGEALDREKELWLHTQLRIAEEAVAESELNGKRTTLRSVILRYWRQYLRQIEPGSKYREYQLQALREQVAERRRREDAERGPPTDINGNPLRPMPSDEALMKAWAKNITVLGGERDER